MADEHRIRGVYGSPLSKLSGQKVKLSRDLLEKAAVIILDQIKREIAKDTLKAVALRPPGEPVPIPKTKKFADSFKFRIKGKSTIEITSDWPTSVAHTTPADEIDLETKRPKPHAPIKMWWLTRPKVPFARIVRQDGEVIVRTTPLSGSGDVWIHPGFRKYTFIERGLRKGRKKAMEAITPDIVAQLLASKDLFG